MHTGEDESVRGVQVVVSGGRVHEARVKVKTHSFICLLVHRLTRTRILAHSPLTHVASRN